MTQLKYPIPVIVDLIPDGHPNKPGKPNTMEHQIIHGTGNIAHGADDKANAAYFRRLFRMVGGKPHEARKDILVPFRYGSAHKIIDRDSVTICIEDTEGCYGAGDRPNYYYNLCKGQTPVARDVFGYQQNYRAIHYELAMNGDWAKVLDNAVEVIAIDYVNLGMTGNQYRHEDVTGKMCPGWLHNLAAWKSFVARIAARIDELKEETSVEKINVFINGKKAEGFLKNGVAYAPVRAVAETLGMKIAWDGNVTPKVASVTK